MSVVLEIRVRAMRLARYHISVRIPRVEVMVTVKHGVVGERLTRLVSIGAKKKGSESVANDWT